MAMTATERSRVMRERRAAGKIVLTVAVSEEAPPSIHRQSPCMSLRSPAEGALRARPGARPKPDARCTIAKGCAPDLPSTVTQSATGANRRR
jgi:hypothetical protein